MGLFDGIANAILGHSNSGDEYNKMIQQAQSIPLPILKQYYPELYKQVASLNPEKDTAINLGPSQMAGVATDPSERQAQMSALSKLQDIGNAGGRDAQFMADQSQLQSDINTNTQGQEGAIEQNLAARGMGGGMSEMVQRNLAAQGGANREAQMAMEAKAQAQQRALQALSQSGQMAGQMQNQDFNQAAAKAQAADAISKFNAQNAQNVQSQNVANANQAQQVNMNAAQTAADKSTQAANQGQQYNLGLDQQNYDNQLKKQGLVNQGMAGKGQAQDAEQDRNSKFFGNILTAGGLAYGRK